MDKQLDELEQHIQRLITQFSICREELTSLKIKVRQLEQDNQHLHEKLNISINRIESILTRIPEC